MKIAINGAGVAGPTLAWWLQHYGHQAVLFENAPRLRTGGYLIDFWGVGYDVAEKMGLLPALREKGYLIQSLRMVDQHGAQIADLDVNVFRSLTNNRFFSIARGDIAATIYHACEGVETRFGTSIVGIDQQPERVVVQTLDQDEQAFDLVVGADGLHSQVRSLAFGPESQFERDLGFYVAAFAVRGYKPRDELTYVTHTVPKRQVARGSLRDDLIMFLFVFRAELLHSQPGSPPEPKAVLRDVFGDMGWEVPRILACLDEVDEVYFDHVSQIVMDRWTKGRVALLGDAAACVSFLAGEGTGLAMTEAYVLAGELHRARGDYVTAFGRYEAMLRPFLAGKQEAARRFAGFFAPKNAWRLFLRNLGTRASSIPFVASLLVGRSLRDDFELPDYDA